MIIKCPNPNCGYRFPVNSKKHPNRRERFCPKCRTPIIIRKRFRFLPNPNWYHERAEQTYQRTRIKEMSRKPSHTPPVQYWPVMSDFLIQIGKRQEELERERGEE